MSPQCTSGAPVTRAARHGYKPAAGRAILVLKFLFAAPMAKGRESIAHNNTHPHATADSNKPAVWVRFAMHRAPAARMHANPFQDPCARLFHNRCGRLRGWRVIFVRKCGFILNCSGCPFRISVGGMVAERPQRCVVCSSVFFWGGGDLVCICSPNLFF